MCFSDYPEDKFQAAELLGQRVWIDPAGSGPRGWDGNDISPNLFTRTQGRYLQL